MPTRPCRGSSMTEWTTLGVPAVAATVAVAAIYLLNRWWMRELRHTNDQWLVHMTRLEADMRHETEAWRVFFKTAPGGADYAATLHTVMPPASPQKVVADGQGAVFPEDDLLGRVVAEAEFERVETSFGEEPVKTVV